MKVQKLLFLFLLLLLSGCNQIVFEYPANPKVNSEYNRSADIKGIIEKVDVNKGQLLIKGNGFGLNDDGKGIIQLDQEYYSVENFKKDPYIEIWVDSQVQVKQESDYPIISDVGKIDFTFKE